MAQLSRLTPTRQVLGEAAERLRWPKSAGHRTGQHGPSVSIHQAGLKNVKGQQGLRPGKQTVKFRDAKPSLEPKGTVRTQEQEAGLGAEELGCGKSQLQGQAGCPSLQAMWAGMGEEGGVGEGVGSCPKSLGGEFLSTGTCREADTELGTLLIWGEFLGLHKPDFLHLQNGASDSHLMLLCRLTVDGTHRAGVSHTSCSALTPPCRRWGLSGSPGSG